MTKPIRQSVILPASPNVLFKTLLNSRLHTSMTTMPANTSAKAGAKWRAFGGMIWGRNLLIIPNKLIVQAWRSKHFRKSDADSIVVLSFTAARYSTRIDLVHVNVPFQDYKGVSEGWPKFYWKPWKAYLRRSR